MSDLIERDMVIEYCLKLIDVERKQGSDVMNYGQERINQTDTIIAFVENLPSARPKEGEWIDTKLIRADGDTYEVTMCNQCGFCASVQTNFCPNCGADMRGERSGTDKDKFEQ